MCPPSVFNRFSTGVGNLVENLCFLFGFFVFCRGNFLKKVPPAPLQKLFRRRIKVSRGCLLTQGTGTADCRQAPPRPCRHSRKGIEVLRESFIAQDMGTAVCVATSSTCACVDSNGTLRWDPLTLPPFPKKQLFCREDLQALSHANNLETFVGTGVLDGPRT